MTFGEYLKQSRLNKGLKQAEVAKNLGYASAQFVSNWERGLSYPPKKEWKKLIKMYGCFENEFKNNIFTMRYQDLREEIFGK